MALSNMASGTLNKRLKAYSRGYFKGGLTHDLKNSGQTGFTLIELIMVIVILGILSAFALPKFADFTSDAENASIEGALGGVKSAAAIAHASDLAGGSTGSIKLEGTTYALEEGYPTAAQLEAVAGLDGFVVTVDATTTPKEVTVSVNAAKKDGLCFTYIESAGSGAPPTFSPTSGIGKWNADADDCT